MAAPDSRPASLVGRRRFLMGALGGAAGLATLGLGGCGSSNTGSGGEAGARPELVALFSPNRVIAAGRRQRIPFAVVDTGAVAVADTAELAVRVLLDGELVETGTVTGRVVDHDHGPGEDGPDHQHSDLLRYFALRAELPRPGIYDLEVSFGDGVTATLPVQAFDPDEIEVVLPGEAMPALATSTTARPEGVDPLCSLAPEPCPFHHVSLDEALASGRPVAYLVATPAFCSTAYCGPVLETLLAAAPDHPDIAVIHQEVYANASEVGGNYADPGIERAAPLVALGLDFEPSLFLVDGGGTVIDRIDNVFSGDELEAALVALDPG